MLSSKEIEDGDMALGTVGVSGMEGAD